MVANERVIPASPWSRRAWAGAATLAALVLAWAAAGTPLAHAQSSYTWSGATTSSDWSNGANWQGDGAPSGVVDTLTFPALTNPACTSSPTTETCAVTEDDISGVSANAISIDGTSNDYIIGSASDTLTLGSGGLTANPVGSATLDLPIALSAPQTWTIGGGQDQALSVDRDVTGGDSDSLGLNLSGDVFLDLLEAVDVGNVTVSGAGTIGVDGGDLNGSGDNAIDLGGAVNFDVLLQSAATGPITSTASSPGTLIVVGYGGSPDSTLTVLGGFTADSDNSIELYIDSAGTTPGTDFSQITASGVVNLGSARFNLATPVAGCPTLTPGDVYTLIQGSSLTGTFANAPAGTQLTLTHLGTPCTGTADTVQIGYTSNSVTATVVAPTSISTTTTISPSTTSPVTNQSVTLTATVAASSGSPSGTVTFDNAGNAISGCSGLSLSGSGGSLTASCSTSFAATNSPLSLTASYSPASGTNFTGSSSSVDALTVGKDSTSTGLTAAAGATNSSVTYTATVAPAHSGAGVPSGSVQFVDGTTPISSCASQTVSSTAPLSATCTVSNAAGTAHSITAAYSGDVNFAGSTSAAITTPVVTTLPASATSTTSATLTGSVDPGSSATTAMFQYGLTTAYGSTTPVQTVGSDTATYMVSAAVTGLLPNSTYHVRVAATNVLGTTYADDVTFTTPADPPPPPPVLAKTVNVMPVSGTVLIKLPGGKTLEGAFEQTGWFTRFEGPLVKGQGFMPLTEARQIPVGSEVDARQGTLKLISASVAKHKTYSGDFGAGLFMVLQSRKQKGLTSLKLLEGAFKGAPSYGSVCATTGKVQARDAAQAAKSTPKKLSSAVVDLLKSNATGNFQTVGRYASATVVGTQFETIDQCDGTLIKVQRHSVVVDDFVSRHTLTLTAGKSFLAKAPPPKPAKKSKSK